MPHSLPPTAENQALNQFATVVLARVRYWLRVEPDCEPELRDAQTGQPVGPGATIELREELAHRIGF